MMSDRKRGREELDENEFAPLSKRINNLHLHNQPAAQSPVNGHTNGNVPERYQPELTETQNPHYYQKNKVLYEAHLERERRCGPQNP